ncbi:Sorting nexin-2, putative [Pediculus humanus corporis]|uniref:Sorting nexin-2, putative n=1 Tax=Pediculus humanus subsp. corporis TaxID=121224 RepID=E0VQT9_PEDHC|nr:Sorting nexin-2, putative [Pediculus humanus corporis]EEB15745.1 Sorting nexin-2, putative [Pediculus humanus corporis]
MADNDPPPLFDNVVISSSAGIDEDSDNLFVSAYENESDLNTNNQTLLNENDNEIKNKNENEKEIENDNDNDNDDNDSLSETNHSLFESTEFNIEKCEDEHEGNKNNQLLEEIDTENNDQFLEITVTDPQKVKDGIGSYMVYKVNTKTNIPKFRKNQFAVNRRFSDFLGLHEKLVEKYLRAGRIIPPAPGKNVFGATKIKIYNQGELGEFSDFIEKRRAALERFMVRIAAHPFLSTDPDFIEFLEAEGGLPKATNTSALSSAGVLRLFNKVGETVNKITFKMEEKDSVSFLHGFYLTYHLFSEIKSSQIDNLDIQLRKLHASVESLVMHRRELAELTSSFAKSAALLSSCEQHDALSRALSQLAYVEDKVEVLYNNQANSDFSILCELLNDYVALIGAIKDVFHERVKVYQIWQHAQLMLTKKRELKSKFELQERREKSAQVANEIIEWNAKVERGQKEFDNISHMIKKEMERFEINRVKEFKIIIIQYLETIMNRQQELIKHWEGFLPEAKIITKTDYEK